MEQIKIYDPKLQQQVPKEELEKIRMENILLEQQIRESLSQLKTEASKAMLLRAIYYMMAKARIDQYGYIPDPWRDLNDLRELLDFQDTLNAIKDNKKKVETVNQKLSEYMKTIKDFYGEISIKTLKDNYDDSFEISFYTDKIDDTIIKTLEKYKDYEVYDVCCEQYCSLPPIDRRVIILDNRKTKPW